MATSQPKHGRRPLTVSEMMNSLLNEHLQIVDLLDAIQYGRGSHAIGLAARLRSLVRHFKNNKLPLLQHCAAILDLPLTVFVPAPHWTSYDHEPGVEFGFRIFPVKFNSSDIEMDLDVWLSAPFCRFKDNVYTNNDMVRLLADTLGGAHYDKSVEPMADALEGWFTRSFGVKGVLNGNCALVVECGATAVKLCSDVLGAYNGDSARLSTEMMTVRAEYELGLRHQSVADHGSTR